MVHCYQEVAREIHTLRLCFVAVSHGVSLKCGEGASFVWRYTWALRLHNKLTHGELPGTVNVACVLMKTNSAGHMWWCLAWRGVCALGRRNIPPLAFSPYSRSKTTKGCLATNIIIIMMMMTRHEVLLGAVLFDQTARRKHMLHSLRKHTPISNYLAVQKSSCVDLPSHAMGLLLSSWLVHAPPFLQRRRMEDTQTADAR